MTDFGMTRSLAVLADGEPVTGFSRARLTGKETLGLYPMPFLLRLWNLSGPEACRLASAGELTVLRDSAVLAAGRIADACRVPAPEGTVTEAVFSAGLGLWEAPVSLSVEAGVSVSETVRRILEASGTQVRLLSFPGEDPIRTRGQAFSGRAAECVETALSAAGAVGCLAPSGLCAVPASGLPVSLTLAEEDLLDRPVRTGGHLLLLRTQPAGWLPGKRMRVQWKNESAEGLVVERSVDADTVKGNWQAELLLDLER